MRLVDSHGHLNADRFDGDVDLVVGGGPARRRRADPRPGLERALVRPRAGGRGTLAVDGRRGGDPSPRRREGRRGRLGAGAGLGPRRAGRGGGRDGPGLGPDVLALGCAARQPPAQPGAVARDRQAGDPPLPFARGCARRPGLAGRGAAAGRVRRRGGAPGVRWPPARGHPLLQRAGGLRGHGRGDGPRCLVLRPRLPEGRGAVRGGGACSSRRSGCSSRRTRPFLSPPGGPRGRNEPAYVAITARWVAERRGVGEQALGDGLVAAYDATFPRAAPR